MDLGQKADLQAVKRHKGRRVRLKFRYKALIGVTLLTSIAGVAVYYQNSNQPIIDKTVVSKAKFTVYSPSKPPEGYTLAKESVRLDDQTLSYKFVGNDQNRVITVTVQPLPSNFDMARLIGGGSVPSSVTQNGTLYNLSTKSNSQYLLNTGDSLVFFTSTTPIDSATISHLANSLTRQK